MGTLSLLTGIDLLTGKVHALFKDRHRSREFVEFLKRLDKAYSATPRSTSASTIIPRISPGRPKPGSASNPQAASSLPSLPSGSTSSRASPSWPAPCCAIFASSIFASLRQAKSSRRIAPK